MIRTDVEQYLLSSAGVGGALGGSLGGGGAGGVGGGGATAGGGSAGGGGGITVPAGFPDGWAMVPLDMVDGATEDPGRWKADVNADDLQWGFEALEALVLPAMASGKSADYFQNRDAQSQSYGNRSLSDTYSGFFGQNEAIRLEPQGGGRYRIGNGMHRVWVARSMGLSAIPAKVS